MRTTALSFRTIARCALLTGTLIASGTAAADPRSEALDRIMATGPLPCLEEAQPLLAPMWLDFVANDMTEALRQRWRLNDKWEAGNPDFNRARFIIKEGIVRSERRLGALIWPASAAAGVRAGFAKLPLKTLQETAVFLSTPTGKLFWTYEIDLGTCSSVLSVDSAPKPGRQLQKRLDTYMDALRDEHKSLLGDKRNQFKAWERKLEAAHYSAYHGFKSGLTEQESDARRRAIVRRDTVELERIAKPYRLPPKDANDFG